MDNNNNTDTVKKNKLFSYLLFAFFIFFVVTGLFLFLNQKKNNINNDLKNKENQVENKNGIVNNFKNDTLVIPDKVENTSEYSLTLNTDSVDIKPGTIVSVDIYANSNSKNIVGYDLVLKYNPLAFDYLKHEPVVSDIKIYKYRKDDYLTLTGVRNLQSAPTPFEDTKLVTLYFEAKKTGNYDFTLESSYEKTKTDLITDKTEVLIPNVNNLKIEVR